MIGSLIDSRSGLILYTMTMSLVPPGNEAGDRSQTRIAVTTWGGTTSGQDFYLEESGISMPEFPAGILAAVSAIGAAATLLRRQHQYVTIGH